MCFQFLLPSLFLYRQLTINLQLLILPILLKQAAVRMFLLSFQVLIYSLLIVVELNLIVDQLLVFVGLQAIELKVEVETRHRLPHWLIIRHMQLLHVGVRECLLDRYTLRRVKHQHLLHEVDRIAVPLRLGSSLMNFLLSSSSIWLIRSWLGDPISSVIICIISYSLCAGSSTLRLINSARMQPTDQTSIAPVYYLHERMTSGARYQRVAM